ncbi:helix-turn-helix domain-containing protein [Planctomicrobium sp. SH668]|uniref:DnaA/Hda family protein n=1 Tax=Planctomicrobium sp. SH668 TaxID=3448126 RepID=UPI003F5C3238
MSHKIRQSDQRGFLVLPENELAIAAVKRLAPGVKRRRIWMVTIVGASGSGKSHLARQLLRSWEAENASDGKLLLLTASQFAAQLAEASAAGTILQFQTKYRNDVKLLICEDIHVLGNSRETQNQLLAAVDEITANGGVVLFTSTKMPGSVKGLTRRLSNRMHGGLCIELGLPGPASRRKLIDQFLESQSLPLSLDEIDKIVIESTGSPRELIGLLNQLLSETKLTRGKRRDSQINLGATLKERQKPTDIRLQDITRITAERFGVKPAELKGPSRAQTLSLARQTAMYLARELAQLHYSVIGEHFQRGNHSTVIHACQKISERLQIDTGLLRHIQAIKEELQA